MLELFDIVKFSPDNKDGSCSVSEGKVFFGKLPWMTPFAVDTVCCREHGACNAMQNWGNGKLLWRCPTCHEGAVTMPRITQIKISNERVYVLTPDEKEYIVTGYKDYGSDTGLVVMPKDMKEFENYFIQTSLDVVKLVEAKIAEINENRLAEREERGGTTEGN